MRRERKQRRTSEEAERFIRMATECRDYSEWLRVCGRIDDSVIEAHNSECYAAAARRLASK